MGVMVSSKPKIDNVRLGCNFVLTCVNTVTCRKTFTRKWILLLIVMFGVGAKLNIFIKC